jgi:hypothetical protein
MERHLVLNKNEVTSKIPEIEKSLNAIEVLMKKQVVGSGLAGRLSCSSAPTAFVCLCPVCPANRSLPAACCVCDV